MKNRAVYIVVFSLLLLAASAHAVERTGLIELTPEESRQLHQKYAIYIF